MSALEEQQQQQQLEVHPDVDAFVTGIAFSLQKSNGQQHKHLFADICNLIYDTLYPRCVTALCPRNVHGAEPNLAQFHPPCPVGASATPSVHGDNTSASYSNWSCFQGNTNYQVDQSGEATHTIPFKEC